MKLHSFCLVTTLLLVGLLFVASQPVSSEDVANSENNEHTSHKVKVLKRNADDDMADQLLDEMADEAADDQSVRS